MENPWMIQVRPVLNAQGAEEARSALWNLATTLGAELPKNNLRTLRAFQRLAEDALDELYGGEDIFAALILEPRVFRAAVIYALLHVCGAYDAQVTDGVEYKAERKLAKRRRANKRRKGK